MEAASINYVNVPMKGVVAPTNEQIGNVFAPLNWPGVVSVHSKASRTGRIVSCHRIEQGS